MSHLRRCSVKIKAVSLYADDIKTAKDTLRHLIRTHGVDMAFIRQQMRTIALEKMAEHLYSEVKKETQNTKP